MKPILFIACFIYSLQTYSQTYTKYYDSNWQVTPKEKAFFYTNFVKENEVYRCTSYWADSNQLQAISTYSDTNFTRGIGTQVNYYRSGITADSLVFGETGNILSYDHNAKNGLHEVHAFYDEKEHYMKGERFDNNGNKMPGFFTFQKQAMFPGGAEGWRNYLLSHLKSDVPSRKKAPVGDYTVMVSFLVMKDGKISEVKAENDPGYNTAEEAVRVIKSGPNWIPAVQNDKPVIYRQKQSITFQVIEARK